MYVLQPSTVSLEHTKSHAWLNIETGNPVYELTENKHNENGIISGISASTINLNFLMPLDHNKSDAIM